MTNEKQIAVAPVQRGSFLKKLSGIHQKMSSCAQGVGVVGMVLMMVITFVDVVGSKVFLAPVFGSVDMVMIVQVVAMVFAASMTAIKGMHIRVDFFLLLMPARMRRVVESFDYLISFLFFVVLTWRFFLHAYSFQSGGEVSATARIPLFPFTYGVAVACIPIFLGYFLKFSQMIFKEKGSAE